MWSGYPEKILDKSLKSTQREINGRLNAKRANSRSKRDIFKFIISAIWVSARSRKRVLLNKSPSIIMRLFYDQFFNIIKTVPFPKSIHFNEDFKLTKFVISESHSRIYILLMNIE